MSLSELISVLGELLAEHGDLPVYVNDTKEDIVELPHDWINIEKDDAGNAHVYIG